jgi:hypothetical protein
MGNGIRCSFKEGTDAIVAHAHSMFLGNIWCLLGYTGDSCVLIQFLGDKLPVFFSFSEVAPLKMGGSYPQLSQGHPHNNRRIFFTVSGYAGVMAQVVNIVAHVSTAVVLLNEEKWEVSIGKIFLMLTTAVVFDPWTEADDEFFTPWATITLTRGMEEGRLLYHTQLW